ncbi:MAG: YcaO-like family protein [Desulfovibrionaceae bacterium]
MSTPFAYSYTHSVTEATTGYFSCDPPAGVSFDEALKRLEASPMDEFLHSYALRLLGSRSLPELETLQNTALGTGTPCCPARPVLAALLFECAILNPAFAALQTRFQPLREVTHALIPHTPLIFLRWSLQEDNPLHAAWSALFAANITEHQPLPHPGDEDLPPLHFPPPHTPPQPPVTLAALHAQFLAPPRAPLTPWSRPPAQETATRALELLIENGVIAGVEMRHEASLSPIALLRKWRVNIAVRNGSLNYTLQGEATTYGRGLSVAAARASYAMEMIERASAYASVDTQGIVGSAQPMPLVKARYSALCAQGISALDPNRLPLDVPYADAPVHWLTAHEAGSQAPVLVPAQSVYLFCNLDEAALMQSAGSTGLASGNTLDEAKAAALTEIFERDAEATQPFNRQRCFTLRSTDPLLQSLLDDYAARGIQIQFQDITTELGLPCYQCFVRGAKGTLARATGANLKGARAALAALTETPYPYPHGPQSGPALPRLPERLLEELPDYSLESPTRNVALLEKVLYSHGLQVLYVEITRKDLEFPVVRALIPGLELGSEFDAYSRIGPRLYRNYLAMFDA